MFNMYRRRYFQRARMNQGGSEEELGHDRFNYMNPCVNYDKWPRRLRPKKNSLRVELEAPESPHLSDTPDNSSTTGNGNATILCHLSSSGSTNNLQRHCHGSLREHQRLLSLRSNRHKCSPRCRVKNVKPSSPTVNADALVKVFACLGVNDSSGSGNRSSADASFGELCSSTDKLNNSTKGSGHHKRPKRLGVLSASFSSFRYTSRTKNDYGGASSAVSNGAAAGASGIIDTAAGVGGIELYEMDSRCHKTATGRGSDIREMATDICRQYIRSSSRYVLLDHLQDIGSRIDKQWFMIRDATLKTERLLTIVPLSGSVSHGCDVTASDADATRIALVDLFTALQHPYIYPVLDVDFVYGAVTSSTGTYSDEAKPVLVTVFPFNTKGSLKDLIYRSRWQDDWGQKYRQRSDGLPLLQVQRLGRQILEALLFLQERGFPPFGHLHSGNVIIQNGVARLTGFENTLLGFSSRIHPLVKSILPGLLPEAVDTICFGHVLFEMCSGYELYAPKPTARHMEDIHHPQVTEVLDYIFNHPDGQYPSIGSLSVLEFFRNIDLREMRCSTVNSYFSLTQLLEPVRMYYNAKLTGAALSLLEQVQRKRLSKHGRGDSRSNREQQTQEKSHPSSKLDSISVAPATAERKTTSVSGRDVVARQIDIHYIKEECEQREENEAEQRPPLHDDLSASARRPPPDTVEQAASTTQIRQLSVGQQPCKANDLQLHFPINGGIRNRPAGSIPFSSTSPSLMMASLSSTAELLLRSGGGRQSEQQLYNNVTAQMNNFYCSSDSECFQTPLESPSVEREYFYHRPTSATAIASGSDSIRPSLVLTPPSDLHDEAF